MNAQHIFSLIFIIMMLACNTEKSKVPDQWNKIELNEWFNKGEWKQGWEARPDESINKKEFAKLYYDNPERWNKAFRFLSGQNLAKLENGTHELEGTDLFAIVDEYETKDEKDASFEAHKKYVDIQVMISGVEKIGVLPLENTSVTTPYNEDKDIMFLTAQVENYRIATPGKFFLFLPGNAHKPSVKKGENIKVKKIVVKVRI